MTELVTSPSMSLSNGRPCVSSLAVAEHFGKRHDNVIRDIRKIMDSLPDDFNTLNFEAVKYIDAKGEERESFNLFRDGFMIVVMGYVGKKAMIYKVAYIRRFNEMERALLEGTHGEPVHLPLANKEQRKPLVDLVRLWVSMAPIGYGDGFRQVNAAMGVSSVEQMTLEMVDRAVAWVQGKIDAIQLGQAALPPAIPVESEDFQKLDALYAEFLRLEESMNREVHAFTDRLRDVTGPLYQEAVRRMTTPGLVALPDGMISGLHSQMRTGATLLKEGMESIGTSLYQARNCARLMMRK